MPKNLFIYIVVNLMLLQIMSLELAIIEQVVNIICVLSIATLGVAHGSIDDVLHGSHKGKQRLNFIIKYVAVIGLIGILWLLFPDLAFLLFISASAFHFGQTQLTGFNFKSKIFSSILYFLWGSFVILSMFVFNEKTLLQANYDVIFLPELYYYVIENSKIYLILISTILPILLVVASLKKGISINSILKEIYLLILICCSFLILKPFIAFSLFFILIHSSQAVLQEYEFCKKEKLAKNLSQFLVLFLPLTLSSLFMVGIVLLALVYFEFSSFIPFALIILLSAVTIPHCFVMDKFYTTQQE